MKFFLLLMFLSLILRLRNSLLTIWHISVAVWNMLKWFIFYIIVKFQGIYYLWLVRIRMEKGTMTFYTTFFRGRFWKETQLDFFLVIKVMIKFNCMDWNQNCKFLSKPVIGIIEGSKAPLNQPFTNPQIIVSNKDIQPIVTFCTKRSHRICSPMKPLINLSTNILLL